MIQIMKIKKKLSKKVNQKIFIRRLYEGVLHIEKGIIWINIIYLK